MEGLTNAVATDLGPRASGSIHLTQDRVQAIVIVENADLLWRRLADELNLDLSHSAALGAILKQDSLLQWLV
jgi:hypothetical protein